MGFILTGCGLPLLGLVAIALSRSEGLYDLGCKVSKPYSMFFTLLLYLTIGPFFAIPRTATVSYTVGIVPAVGKDTGLALLVFSVIFFSAALWFSLRPSKIMLWVGKLLNPIFLVFLALLLIMAFTNPIGSVSSAAATGEYAKHSFFSGFIQGYNTMDALASLAFGIIVINSVRNLGVSKPKNIARYTVYAGIFAAVLMALIYAFLAIAGAQSRGSFPVFENGGIFLNKLSSHYFGTAGAVIMAITITVACLKTCIGLITACAETFGKLFPGKLSYRSWVFIFTLVSFTFANFGLEKIISYSVPMLMLLYPLTIVIILLSIFGGFFDYSSIVYKWTIGFTMISAVADGLKSLPEPVVNSLHLGKVNSFMSSLLPFSDIGMDWIIPALIGFGIGMISLRLSSPKTQPH